ncbi:MAG: DNA cytosine methyltransferase [Erysipelotrichaceae bacterium]|nr:DNA cytosine methyltransferase [Erysipelotrichaceae bacterium]
MLKVLSLFSGIGAFEKALARQGIEYQLVGYCEIDKYASKSYSLIHNVSEQMNLGDITKIDTLEMDDNIDFITYGFPCQDISLAGKQKGFEQNGELTRSGLFFWALRIIEDLQPKVAICENVKNLTSKRFSKEFGIVLKSLEEAGYNNYWQVLNAKDFGIPQNRERVFIVSIRKDIDTGSFEFPKPFELKLRLKDMLEDEVDEKYYLKDTKDFFIKNSFDMEQKGNGFRFDPHVKQNANISKTITTIAGARMDDNFILENIDTDKEKFKFDSTNEELKSVRLGGVFDTEKSKHQAGSVWDKDGLSPTLDTMQGGWRQPCIIDDNDIKLTGAYGRNFGSKGKLQDKDSVCDTLLSAMGSGGGNVPIVKEQENTAQIIREEPLEREGWHRNAKEVLNINGICRTLSTQSNNLATKIKEQKSLRIRKLTPRECFRLMGFDDSDFDKVEGNLSNTQLYKQAGNSIVVNVLEEIYKELFKSIKL